MVGRFPGQQRSDLRKSLANKLSIRICHPLRPSVTFTSDGARSHDGGLRGQGPLADRCRVQISWWSSGAANRRSSGSSVAVRAGKRALGPALMRYCLAVPVAAARRLGDRPATGQRPPAQENPDVACWAEYGCQATSGAFLGGAPLPLRRVSGLGRRWPQPWPCPEWVHWPHLEWRIAIPGPISRSSPRSFRPRASPAAECERPLARQPRGTGRATRPLAS